MINLALKYKKKKYLKLEEVKIKKITRNDVLIKIRSCGICGSDLKIVNKGSRRVKKNTVLGHEISGEIVHAGLSKYFKKGQKIILGADIPRAFNGMAYSYPLVMGHEFVGRIIETGKSVREFSVGDMVSVYPLIPQCIHKTQKNKCDNCKEENYNLCNNYSYYGSRTDGSFCEVLDVFQWNLYKINKKIDYNICSLIEPTAVAFNIINKFNKLITRNTRILLIGSGFIGQIIARILKKKIRRLNLTVIDRNLFKLKKIRKFSSAQYVFRNENTREDNYLTSALRNKYDIVIENSGNNKNFVSSISFAKKNGLVIFSGNPNNDIKLSKNILSDILRKELLIKGVWNSSFKKKMNNWKSAENFLSETKNNNLNQLITHTVYLDEAKELLNNIYIAKNKKTNFHYIKGTIKSY